MVKYFLNIILFLNVEILLFMYKFKNLDIKLDVVYIYYRCLCFKN